MTWCKKGCAELSQRLSVPQAAVPKRNVPVLPLYNAMFCQVEVGCQGIYSDFPPVPGRAKPLRKAKPHPAL